jgi:cation:H+ antiporter
MALQFLIIVLGFVLLIKGADWLVNGASKLARKYQISDLAIGLTIVAFGTSAPELVVNVIASIQGHQGIVFGNIIGSNNFNLFLILGITGLITPLVVRSSTVWREIPISFIAVVLLFVLSNGIFKGQQTLLSRIDGLLLLAMFGAFLYYVSKQLKFDNADHHSIVEETSDLKLSGLIVAGLLLLVLGGRLVVTGAVEVATRLGISETIIGLTIIAAGTSLPELVTSVVAATKKNIDIAVGNIIGSNIFNIFLILGVSALIRPVQFEVALNTELLLLALGTLFLFLAMFTGGKKKLDRWEAVILLVVYLGYTIYLIR